MKNMIVPFNDLRKQYLSIKNEIDEQIQAVLLNSEFIRGKNVSIFEKNFAKKIGVKHCIGVGNGTDALYLSLLALNIGTGDEVITAANTFIATAEAITRTGARVVFTDCDYQTFNIDSNQIINKITDKTKALIPVHLYGLPAEMNSIMQIARKYNLYVIEDCAQAHLAYIKSNQKTEFIGSIGHLGAFSFYPGKNLGAYGDAGAVVTNNKNLSEKILMLSNHGRLDKYNHEIEGINSRMDGLQGAILNVKLKYLDLWTQKRIEIAKKYNELLKNIHEIKCPVATENSNHVFHLFVIKAKKRDDLVKYLSDLGISVGIHYPQILPNLKAYKKMGHQRSDFPNASKLENEILSLPIFPEISDEQIQFVAESIKAFYGK